MIAAQLGHSRNSMTLNTMVKPLQTMMIVQSR
jgi:hypothetical protein